MKQRLKFIIPLCCIAVLVLILGECLIGLVFNNMIVSRVWLILVIVGTCAFSIWHSVRNEKE